MYFIEVIVTCRTKRVKFHMHITHKIHQCLMRAKRMRMREIGLRQSISLHSSGGAREWNGYK